MISLTLFIALAAANPASNSQGPWVDVTTGDSGKVYLNTRSVVSDGDVRTASVVMILTDDRDVEVRDLRLEMNCTTGEYRIAETEMWEPDDPQNVERVCRVNYKGLRHFTDDDIKRLRASAPK